MVLIFRDEKHLIAHEHKTNMDCMRMILVEWLIGVHLNFNLPQNTLHLAIHILDYYLNIRFGIIFYCNLLLIVFCCSEVSPERLQLVGCTCLWVACKFHAIKVITMNDLVYVSDNAFNENDIIIFEPELVNAIQCNFTVPTPISFIKRFVKV